METKPDVIILDLMMPGMSGFEVAGALKDNSVTERIPILVLTSKAITPRPPRAPIPEYHSAVEVFATCYKAGECRILRYIASCAADRAGAKYELDG